VATKRASVRLGCRFEIAPMVNKFEESSINLYSVEGGTKKLIRNVSDIDDLAELKNPNDALSYARLFTGYDTHYLFRGINALEVSQTSKAYDDGWGVTLSSDWSDENEIEKPTIYKMGNNYIIERCLVSYPDPKTKKSQLYRSRETISPNGKYHHQILKIIQERKMKNGINISLPYY
jgi:hypothetical protein